MNKTNGFTLIEMLTVVLIIGILTGIVVPQYRRAIQKAQATEAVAMLRTIHDSGERLANEYGYRSFQGFSSSTSADKDKAVFARMDMFNKETIRCTFTTDVMTCDHFLYNLGKGKKYITATKRENPYKDTILCFCRKDIPVLKCVGDQDACDLYSLDKVNSCEAGC